MDRGTRIRALGAVLLVLAAVLAVQAATAGGAAPAAVGDGRNATLVTVQSYGGFGNDNGKAVIVQDGDVVWEYDPPNSRVFDAEVLENGNVMASVATRVPAEDCPDEYVSGRKPDHCVHNRVVELDYDTKEVVWEYDWYDQFITHHEVHDADRLETGETAIIDMGNNRAFTVAENGTITWEWQAENHLTPGTEFYEEYGGDRKEGPESDWTHMNDIDRLENGNFQLSIRNFDVVIEVDPETNEIVDVVGEPRGVEGNDPILHEQHNPHRLEEWGTVLVADSENDRVVELDVETGEVVWQYGGGRLTWPRDADRLPNGHTLITDSLNFRVIEVDEDGEVVWQYTPRDGGRGIPYEADRITYPEEPGGPPGSQLAGATGESGAVDGTVQKFAAFALVYLPPWVGFVELLALVGGVVVSLLVLLDLSVLGVRRLRAG